ncbi:hypothetical protein NPIL_66671 [Nephila pilipes]|uniref:Uncharacterized protein n=1 Tax=Nephila pilipes TaxID=299642 RepID=A0A8X6I5E9_NEPPI|nr:hypothetical protein NPIL_66671 [Nephila pilipes]
MIEREGICKVWLLLVISLYVWRSSLLRKRFTFWKEMDVDLQRDILQENSDFSATHGEGKFSVNNSVIIEQYNHRVALENLPDCLGKPPRALIEKPPGDKVSFKNISDLLIYH